jgi:hypothetical protein
VSVSEPTPPPPVRTGNTTLLAAVALVVTFIAGLVVGAVGARFLNIRRPERLRPPAAEFMMKRLDRSLDLTPQQEVEITSILQRHHQRIGAVWTGVRPQLRREVEQTNAEIQRVLTPEQRTKFEGIKMRLMPRERHGIRNE